MTPKDALLRLLAVAGLTGTGLGLLFVGYLLALIASFLIGAGASGGMGMAMDLFRPAGRAAITFVLCGSACAAVAAMVDRSRRWPASAGLSALVGGVAAVFIPGVEAAVVGMSCEILARVNGSRCL